MIYNQNKGMMLLRKVKKDLTMNAPYKKLRNYINELVADRAIWDRDLESFALSVDDLTYEEQGKLAALFLDYEDRDTTDCFNNPAQTAIDDDITCALLKLLNNDTLDNRQDLACMIRENTINRFKKSMQDFIDHMIVWREVA